MRRSGFRLGSSSCLLVAALGIACATGRLLERGEPQALGPDEGVLVLQIETDLRIEGLRFTTGRIDVELDPGRHLLVAAMSKGRYAWTGLVLRDPLTGRTRDLRFRERPEEMSFTVEPGRTNLAGLFRYERHVWSYEVRQVDRTAWILAQLQRDRSDLLDRYPVRYAGMARHVFLDHYTTPSPATHRAREEEGEGEGEASDDDPAAALFRERAIGRVVVSPSGALIAAEVSHEGYNGVMVQVTKTGEVTPLFRTEREVRIGWVDGDTLMVGLWESVTTVEVWDFHLDEGHALRPERNVVAVPGWPVDLLPTSPDELLWAVVDPSASRVYRVPTAELIDPTARGRRGYGASGLALRYRAAVVWDPVSVWIADREGVPRAALVVEGEDPVRVQLLYREDADSRWDTIGEFEGEDHPEPVGIASNGHDLLVLSGEGRDTKALRVYLVDEERLGETLWASPDRDAVGVVYAYEGNEVTAVVYEEAGIRRYHYLDDDRTAHQQWAAERHPGENVVLTSRSADGRYSTYWVGGPTNPGVHWFRDGETGSVLQIGLARPWIDPSELAPVEALQVETDDGFEVEAFLTRPRHFSGDRPPLVVMPHGGPIGVSDSRSFDPLVQYLAAHGYAVLQVNYRGSEGRGRRFLDAGRGAWGEGIEDDIEAAVDAVVARRLVDPDRMCLFGGSYGGYSSLIAATRRPQRYRCAAAAAAPSDLLLMFDSSDFAASEEGRKRFAEVVGDPDEDRERLVRVSPAYRASEIDIPVLLVHGVDDRRVDVDHAWRMRAMLEAEGRPPEWLVVDDMEHSPTPEQWVVVMTRVRRFLDAHLAPAAPAAPSTAAESGP